MKRKLTTTIFYFVLVAITARAQDTVTAADSVRDGANHEPVSVVASVPADPKVSVTMSSVSIGGPSYVIGSDDMLHISVWKEPDLTATLPVRADGMISLPLLNDVAAAGLTPMQLAAFLQQKLKRYIAAPRVTVIVTQTNSQRVYVLGEVQRTGPIGLTPNMTVLQVLATAGLTAFANTKGIYVLRNEGGQQQKLAFNYKQVVKGEAMLQNIPLKPGDTIVVP